MGTSEASRSAYSGVKVWLLLPKCKTVMPALLPKSPPTRACVLSRASSAGLGADERWSDTAVLTPMMGSMKATSCSMWPVMVGLGTA